MNTIKRFENGVHTRENCGKNKSGYAAIGALFGSTDVHRLGRVMTSLPDTITSHQKKKTFAYSDILTYIFMKVLLHNGTDSVYILFLSSGSFIPPTVQDIISSLSQMMNLIVIVQRIESGLQVTQNFAGVQISQTYRDEASLIRLFSTVGGMEDAFAIIHPVVEPVYRSVVTQCGIQKWCVPSSRSEIYVSKSSTGNYFHNVFPWSKHPCYSGFTIGSGTMELGSSIERHKYIGAFNSYEILVSSVPIGNICTDCATLKRIAKLIQMLTGKMSTRHKHTISESSIKALEEAQQMIKELMEQS